MTEVMSSTMAEVKQVSRPVADLRLCHRAAGDADVDDVDVVYGEEEQGSDNPASGESGSEGSEPTRTRRPPA